MSSKCCDGCYQDGYREGRLSMAEEIYQEVDNMRLDATIAAASHPVVPR